ncbi:protein lin-54 homolog [Uloborus diversus]|uniref:protein lin-54 homolog n=1 Tax=Uloborus diversus TaxID=327109 RepID=UPI002409468B|nr:protein lin-54 homolog [Uloborus diversus]
MPSERMELSPKADIDLNESSLSFMSSLSSGKDEDSILMPDTMNIVAENPLGESILRTDTVDCNQDLFNISFDKNSLNSDPSDNIVNTLSSVDGTVNLSNFSIISDANLMTNAVQSSDSSFLTPISTVTSVPAIKSADAPLSKVGLVNTNKSNPTQVLIFQKPPTNLSTVFVGAKGVPGVSASNVALVPQSGVVSAGTKILTLPTVNATGNILNAIAPSTAAKPGDVKILLSQVPGTTPTLVANKPVVSTIASSSNTSQGPVKRAVTPSSTGQMITKVIITNNAASNQTLVSPVPVSATATTPIVVTQSQPILLASPNKTYTLSRNLLNISGSPQVLREYFSSSNQVKAKGTPTKQYLLSPVKPTQKVAYAPVTYSRSPRRIAPATNVTVSNLSAGNKVATVMCPTNVTAGVPTVRMSVPQSPTKVILKPVPQTVLKPITGSSTATATSILTSVAAAATTTVATVQATQPSTSGSATPIQVPGNKFHYVRLVSASTTSTTTTPAKKETTLMPVSSVSTLTTNLVAVTTTSQASTSQIGTTVPIAPAKPAPKPIGPKFLIPSSTSSQIRTSTGMVSTGQLNPLSGGTLFPVAGSSNYVMVPTQYVTQIQQPSSVHQISSGTQMLNILPAPTPNSTAVGSQSAFISLAAAPQSNFHSASSAATAHHSPRSVNGRAPPVENDTRPRKPCNCTKSQCLKLYCDCFANGEFCNSCNCNNCYNNLTHEEERQKAIKACLDRNPLAFHPKIGKSREGDQERRHTKGCNCKRSGCLKNYCECYEAKILCTNLCKCIGCKNFEDSSERKTLMHLADAAEVRVQQQAAAKTNLSSQMLDIPTKPPGLSRTGERLPFAFVTEGVLEATCLCLLAQASDAEKSHASEEEIERLVLQEFSRCLVRIIDCANKTKVSKMDVQ